MQHDSKYYSPFNNFCLTAINHWGS
jgi:hypothetical protein